MDKEQIEGSDGFVFDAVRVPAEGARKGGLVMIQEIFGLNSFMLAAARRFAAEGFEVLLPSMFDRQETGFVREGHDQAALVAGSGHARANGLENAMTDIAACIDMLEGPVFITGFCYGGSMSYHAACQLDGLSAASCYYGSLLPKAKDNEPKCPTIAHFGKHDPHIPLEGVEAFKQARHDVLTYIYDAGHGFARQGSDDYDAKADELAFERTLKLFDEDLIR